MMAANKDIRRRRGHVGGERLVDPRSVQIVEQSDLQQAELEKLVEDFEKEGIAHVDVSSGYSIISL